MGRHLLLPEGALHTCLDASIECEEVQTDVIYVQGAAKGNVHARKALEIEPNAEIPFDIQHSGRLDVHGCAAAQRTRTPPPELGVRPSHLGVLVRQA